MRLLTMRKLQAGTERDRESPCLYPVSHPLAGGHRLIYSPKTGDVEMRVFRDDSNLTGEDG